MSSNPAEGCFVFCCFVFVFVFLINDSFLAFVTSSSLLVVGTTQSYHHLLPALPVPEDRRTLSISRQGHLWLWFILRDVKELKLPLSTELRTASEFGEGQRYTCVLAVYRLYFFLTL